MWRICFAVCALACVFCISWSIYAEDRNSGSSVLRLPLSVVVQNSNVYVADTGNEVIREGMSVVAGNGHKCQSPTDPCGDERPAREASLNFPSGVALDAAGNIYIADSHDNRVRVVNMQSTTISVAGVTIPPGDIDTVAGTGVACPSPPSGCGDGGPATMAQVNLASGVTVDSQGNIYIADSKDNRIREVSPQGIIVTIE